MKKIILLSVLLVFSNISCSVYETFVNISRLKFKLGNVNNFKLSGISLADKRKLEDFTPFEALKISSDFASGKLPVSFVLNVEAKNPNDGTGGYKKTNATIQSFPWRLFLDDKETISGNIDSPVTVPGTGEAITIPFSMSLDLYDFFEQRGYNSIINLALNIGGYSESSSKIALFVQPTVATALGNIKYPEEIKVVDFEYSK